MGNIAIANVFKFLPQTWEKYHNRQKVTKDDAKKRTSWTSQLQQLMSVISYVLNLDSD